MKKIFIILFFVFITLLNASYLIDAYHKDLRDWTDHFQNGKHLLKPLYFQKDLKNQLFCVQFVFGVFQLSFYVRLRKISDKIP